MKTQKKETNARRPFLNAVTTSLCTALVAGTLILFAPETGFSQGEEPVGPPKPVKIINTETEPVPVKGSVAVTGNVTLAPGTKVGIDGTANVNLVDKSVIVANSELAPVLVRDILRKPTTPVHAAGEVLIIFDEPKTDSTVIYTVPPGKRLVIEFIGADLLVDETSLGPVAWIRTQLGGTLVNFPLTLTPQNEDYERFGFTGMTKMYADPGTDVTITLILSEEPTSINSFSLKFSGYLEDL